MQVSIRKLLTLTPKDVHVFEEQIKIDMDIFFVISRNLTATILVT
jgi:hypothetical protein